MCGGWNEGQVIEPEGTKVVPVKDPETGQTTYTIQPEQKVEEKPKVKIPGAPEDWKQGDWSDPWASRLMRQRDPTGLLLSNRRGFMEAAESGPRGTGGESWDSVLSPFYSEFEKAAHESRSIWETEKPPEPKELTPAEAEVEAEKKRRAAGDWSSEIGAI